MSYLKESMLARDAIRYTYADGGRGGGGRWSDTRVHQQEVFAP